MPNVPGVSLSVKESVMIHFERLIKLLQLQPGTYMMKEEGLDGTVCTTNNKVLSHTI